MPSATGHSPNASAFSPTQILQVAYDRHGSWSDPEGGGRAQTTVVRSDEFCNIRLAADY